MIFGSVYSRGSKTHVSGLLEQANEGTLYLEDVAALPEVVQSRLLRFIESGGKYVPLGGTEEMHADVRIICSCHQSSLELIKNNMILLRLFYCLSVIYIHVPSLNDRRDEIPELSEFYIAHYNRLLHKNVIGLEPDVLSFFKVFEWPGNLIQFSKCIEASINLAENGKPLQVEDLPVTMFYGIGNPSMTSPALEDETKSNQKNSEIITALTYDPEYATKQRKKIVEKTQQEEKNRIIQALQECNGNITHAAKKLEISRQLLYYRIKKYKIQL